MAISVRCQKCGMIFSTSTANGGRKFQCKNCRNAVTFPAAAFDNPFGNDASAFEVGDEEDGWQDAIPAAPRKRKRTRKSSVGSAPPGFYPRELSKLGLAIVGLAAACGLIYLGSILMTDYLNNRIDQINAEGRAESRRMLDMDVTPNGSLLDEMRGRSATNRGGFGSSSRMHGGGSPSGMHGRGDP